MSTQPLTIPEARARLSPVEFRATLRRTLIEHPHLTLKTVANTLGVTRQRVNLMVGALGRPSCARPNKPAPRKEQARAKLAELKARVQAGETAEQAAAALGISLNQAMQLGFRVKEIRPPHGSNKRTECRCWRCRHAGGIALPRGPRTGAAKKEAVLDWLAWADPDTGDGLRQVTIGRLAGVAQPVVSRIARQVAG